MPQSQDNQPTWWEFVQKYLDNKLVGLGIPGIFIAIAADHARNSRWLECGILLGVAAIAWVVIKIVSKLLPYFDRLLDWLLATQIPKWWTALTDRFWAEYFAQLVAECREYQGRGFSGEGLDLENVFVPLGFSPDQPVYNPQDIHPAEDAEPEPLASNPVEDVRINLALSDSEIGTLLKGITGKKTTWRRLVILGAPGSGKTTLLRHITLLFALRKQSKLHRGLPHLIPVLLRLRDVASVIVADPKPSLADVIVKAIDNDTPQVKQWFDQRLKQGKCLVMLDGLDEVADDGQRQQVSQWVYQQLQKYKNQLPFILSSRPQAYYQAPLPDTAAYFVRPFTNDQRDRFLFSWYFNIEKRKKLQEQSQKQLKRSADSKKNELVRLIDQVPSLRLMAKNPLLLALIINTYKQKTSLAPTQTGLYKQVCEVLLQGRQASGGSTRYPLKPEQKQSALQALALEMSKQQVLQLTLDERNQEDHIFWAKDLLQAELAQMVEAGRELKPEDFIEKDDIGVRELLSDRKQEKVYEFTHRTFQEYLTSVELTDAEHEPYLLDIFAQDAQRLDWWRQTILFYAGQVKIDRLIDAALSQSTVATLTLAYECLQNRLRVSPEKERALLEKVSQGLESPNIDEFKLAASVQLQKRLNFLNADCFGGGGDENQLAITKTPEGHTLWAGQVRDEIEISEAEYRLFLLETSNPDQTATVPPNETNFVERNAFCAWLSQKTQARFGEAGICYVQCDVQATPPPANSSRSTHHPFHIIRFRIPEPYHQLAYYLAAGKWQEADKETLEVMLRVAGQERQGYLDLEDIRRFPCEDLQIIDRLWVQYSNGKFGFSVQKGIWLKVGGWLEGERHLRLTERLPRGVQRSLSGLGVELRGNEIETWKKFCDHVGWRNDGSGYLATYRDLEKSLPGELPLLRVRVRRRVPSFLPSVLSSLSRRLVDCSR